jgi:hypothetical protein
MIKKITFIAFTALFSFVTNAQEKACTKFREGTFKVTDPTSQKLCYITRKGNVQTEKMENSEEVFDFDIVWIDDCTYTVSPTAATMARNKDISKAGTMTVMITKAKDSTYVQRIKVANSPKFRREDKVYLIKVGDKGGD